MSLQDLLAAKQLRPTPRRMAVLDVLRKATKPLDAAEIFHTLKKHGKRVDMVTVYRTLETFAQQGILQTVDFREGKYRYELADATHHHHAVCMNCGAVLDIQDCIGEDIEHDITKKTGFRITSHSLEFFGLCPSCQRLAP